MRQWNDREPLSGVGFRCSRQQAHQHQRWIASAQAHVWPPNVTDDNAGASSCLKDVSLCLLSLCESSLSCLCCAGLAGPGWLCPGDTGQWRCTPERFPRVLLSVPWCWQTSHFETLLNHMNVPEAKAIVKSHLPSKAGGAQSWPAEVGCTKLWVPPWSWGQASLISTSSLPLVQLSFHLQVLQGDR